MRRLLASVVKRQYCILLVINYKHLTVGQQNRTAACRIDDPEEHYMYIKAAAPSLLVLHCTPTARIVVLLLLLVTERILRNTTSTLKQLPAPTS
jgi:hypothetical protein